jgi:hypothetical protein
VVEAEDEMAEATIEALAKLETSVSADCSMVAALMEANSRVVKQLEDR